MKRRPNMKRQRMGAQMRSILEILANLKNSEGSSYNEADWGLRQTDIIMKDQGLKPFTKTLKWGTENFVVPIDEADAIYKKLEDKGKTIKSTKRGNGTIYIEAYSGTFESTPPQMTVASGVMCKHMGQSSSPYNMLGRIQIAHAVMKKPALRSDPVYRRHFDWVDSHFRGKKIADKLYASFSRSLKKLLARGFITSDHVRGPDRVRWFRTRYLITDSGRKYLSKR